MGGVLAYRSCFSETDSVSWTAIFLGEATCSVEEHRALVNTSRLACERRVVDERPKHNTLITDNSRAAAPALG